MAWLLPRNELTPEQNRAIELDANEHKIILGGPGSGKTQILLHRAKYLKEKYKIKNERLHIFVFTNVLKNYISSALKLLDIPEGCVTTFDFWCVEYYQKHIRLNLPWNRKERCPDFDIIRRDVLNYLNRKNIMQIYDIVLVDEGQDLDQTTFEIIKKISSHITVCIDYKQKIYEQGATEERIMEILGIQRKNLHLLDVFRCCPYVVKLASLFIDNENDRNFYINQSRTEQTEKEMPLLYYAKDQTDEDNKVIDLIHTRMLKNERIGIFLPTNKYVQTYAKKLISTGIDVEWRNIQEDDNSQYDFNSTKPKILTFHSAKGLTFDSVIIPKLIIGAFPEIFKNEIKRLLFVGITRAQKWVGLITKENQALEIIDKLKNIKDNNFLTVRSAKDYENYSKKVSEREENDLIDLL
ncbi:MAG: AAA family ATPase [Proteobacteria bacterium]|nr:AAA family ATPase [Pseudomonadota bacterium]